MGKQQSVKGGRPHRLSTALSDEEAQFVDASRGSLSRSEYLRWLVVREKRAQGDPRASGGMVESSTGGYARQQEIGWAKAKMGAHVDVAVITPDGVSHPPQKS